MSSTLESLHLTADSAPPTQGAEAILAAVVFGARTFMSAQGTDALDAWLQQLGVATGSGQVRVFANDDVAPGDPLTASMCAEWKAPGAAGSPREALQHVPYRASGCGRWEELLRAGKPVVGITRELPETERPILEHEGNRSVAIVPVFLGPRWWGFIGFADGWRERRWSEAELNALDAAAGIYGAALARQEMERRIATATVHERLATELGDVLTASVQDLDEILQLCSARIAQHLDVDLVRVWYLDRAGELLRSRRGASRIHAELAPSELRLGESAVGRIARTRESEAWHGPIPELWPGSLELTTELSAGVGHPLVSDGRVVGVVVMLQRHAFSPAALYGLSSVVDELALAIERGRAVSALSLTEDRYRRLVEATVEGICIHDGRRLQDANPSLARMLGYEVSEVIGRSPLEFMHPDDVPDVKRRIATDYTGAYESRMLHRDGSVIPVELKGRNFVYDGVTMRVTSIRDITERKRAERTAQTLIEERTARELSERSRRQAQFLAEASRILSSSFDTTTTLNQLAHLSVRFLADFCVVRLYRGGASDRVAVVHADPAKQELLDRTVDLWGRRSEREEPAAARRRQTIPRVIRSLSEEDLAVIAPDPGLRALVDELAPTTVMSVPILINGELIGTITFAAAAPRDPYGPEELAIAEELGRRAAMALESARSYHDAQAATRARDEMLAVVAHDLRNPLSAIIMGSALALELGEEKPSLEREQFALIKRSGEHMNRLIQDLLDATRLQSGQLALEALPVAPAVIVDDAMEMLIPLAAHAGIALEAQIPPDLDPIRADRLRIVQVLSNLVGNGLKFTPRGGRVTLSVTPGDGELRFCVSDTGPGIPPDQLPHIFGRFWQGRRTDGRGLGLGLAIARGIVEAHGGTIWVESEVGVGSSFRFTVPARPSPDRPASDFALPE